MAARMVATTVVVLTHPRQQTPANIAGGKNRHRETQMKRHAYIM